MTDYSQETIEITEEHRVVMADLNLNDRAIGVGITRGWRAERINEDAAPVKGNVIWGFGPHLDSLRDYYEGEIAKGFQAAPVAQPIQKSETIEKIVYVSDRQTKGQLAYEGKLAGKTWKSLGEYSAALARAYAKSRSLPWPVASTPVSQP